MLRRKIQILDQWRHGVAGAGAVSVSYKGEGFSEPEGEIETVIALGRNFGRASVFANLVYGQDPEARESDGEIRLGATLALSDSLYGGATVVYDTHSREKETASRTQSWLLGQSWRMLWRGSPSSPRLVPILSSEKRRTWASSSWVILAL